MYRGQLARRDATKGAGRESGVLRRGHRDEAELPVLPPRPLAAARRPRQVCSRLPVARAVAVAVAARRAATVGVWVGIPNLLLCRKRGGSGLCPPALRRLLSALDRAASSGQPRPISRAWAAPAGHVGPVFDVAASCSPASRSGSPAASAYKEPTDCMWRARPCPAASVALSVRGYCPHSPSAAPTNFRSQGGKGGSLINAASSAATGWALPRLLPL